MRMHVHTCPPTQKYNTFFMETMAMVLNFYKAGGTLFKFLTKHEL